MYPMERILCSSLTMQAPTCVFGSLERIPDKGRNAHKVFIPADIICTFSAHVPITPTCVRRIKQILFRAENTVSRISESRYNVAVLVQMIVERADVDIHIRMCLLHLFHTFRCCDNAHQADIFYAFIL